jgi:predicted DCC family thiol-disulfide oxidoreductase YuxK
MCASLMGAVRNSTRSDGFDLRDMHAQKSLPFARDAVAKEIHVVDRDGQTYRGAAAILKIVREYPRLRIFAAVGDLPLVRPLLPIGYGVIARNRRFLFGPASRIFWLKAVIIAVFCIGLAMSSRLWIGPRSYPVAPVSALLPSSIYPLDYLLFAALFALTAVILVAVRPQRFIVAFLIIIGFFCLFDQTRWQPWVFQYGFLLAAIALFSWDGDDIEGRKRALNIARLIVAATYVFSGLQKVNFNFIDNEFPWIVEPVTNLLPWARSPLRLLGAAAPFIQIGFGIGLLTRKFRWISLVLAVSMHLFIFAMFGPLGHDWNDVIWPWTAAMAIFDIVLFSGKEAFSFRDIMWSGRRPYHAVAFMMFVILPLGSFFNLWDSFLSSALYSGNLTEATIYATDKGRDSLPAGIRAYLVHTSPNTNVLNIQRWAIEDLNVTPYPETRVYKLIAKALCQQTPYPEDIALLVHEQRMFFSRPEAGYRCWDL